MEDIIRPTDGKIGGFTPMEDGDYTLQVQEDIRFHEEDGVTTERLIIPFKDQEGDGQISIFCDLSKKAGLITLSNLLLYSGLNVLIEKEENLPPLDPKGWSKKVLKSEKLIKILKVKFPGRVIGATVETVERKGKSYTNVSKVYKAGSTPAPVPTSKTESKDEEANGW